MKNKNQNISRFTMVFLLVFIFFATIEHIIDLTKFTFRYNYAFDYGKMIRTLCMSEYFEAETERFQIVKSADDILISNTTNKNRYSLFILIISVFVSLYISMCFGILVSNLFINNKWIDNALGIKHNPDDNNNNLFFQFISEIQAIFNRTISCFMKIFTKPSWQSIVMAMIIIFIHIVVIVCFILVPLYLGLKLGMDFDISPIISQEYTDHNDQHLPSGTAGRMKKRYDRFQKVLKFASEQDNNLPESDHIAIYVLYTLFFLVLVLLRFVYKIKGNDENILIDMISSYFSSNEKNIMTTNSMFGYALYFIFIGIFICIFYLLGNSISLFRKSENHQENNDDDGTLYTNIYGYTEYNNFDGQNLVKKPSGLMFTIAIILFVLITFYFIIPFEDTESNILRYQMILPLAFLAIIMFVVINFTEYNTFANKYIIHEPISLYKKYIGEINPLFNKIISSEYKGISEKTPGYPCKNLINSVYFTLCSHLFNKLDGMKMSNTNNARLLDCTPEMHYNASCETNYPFKFRGQKKYNIAFYLNNKSLNKNIFYDFNKCSEINSSIVSQMKENLKFYNDETQSSILQKIREMPKTNEFIDNINLMLNESFSNEVQEIRDKITSILFANMKNVLNGCVPYDSSKKIIHYDISSNKFYQNENEVTMNDIEIFNHNNKLHIFDTLKRLTNIEEINEYKTFVDEVVSEYMNIMIYHLYALAISSNDEVKYVELLTKGIKNTFNSLENILSTPITKQKSKLTEYIITNFNSLYNDETYSNRFFDYVNTDNKEEEKQMAQNIDILRRIVDQIKNVFSDLNSIILLFNQNGSISSIRIFTQVNDINDKIGTYIQDLDLVLTQNESFQSDIDLIYNKDNPKYMLEYKYVDVKTDVVKNIQINDGIVNILKEMFEICKKTCNEIVKVNELLPAKEIDTEIIDKCKDNLKTFANVIESNISSINNDLTIFNEKEENNLVSASEINHPLRSTSMAIGTKAREIDSEIYIVYFNIIVSIILSNLIIL